MIILQNNTTTLFRSALYETLSAVIQTEDLVLVVDPTWLPHEVEEIRQHTYSILADRPLYLLFTHSDYDHILGYRAFPGAKVIASGAFARQEPAYIEATLEQIRAFDDDYYLTRGYEIEYPAVDMEAVRDGDTLQIGGTRLTFYQAAGHNPDGLFTIVEPLGLWLAGDYLSDIEFPFIYHSSEEYEATLAKTELILERHSIQLLVPGHGEPTDSREEMLRRKKDSIAYIDRMREATLSRNQASIDRIIDGCRFPRNLRKFHQGNQRLFERELGL
ncbi:MBL fold metallo-hydrolase [Paenibacillus sp. GCM10023252]|uniref:MBL fold metallo-hydrolase n=1 Tax=Paenibacillus sp. GCM10023252 TaxID=3252649 RepID=UPI0036150F1D